MYIISVRLCDVAFFTVFCILLYTGQSHWAHFYLSNVFSRELKAFMKYLRTCESLKSLNGSTNDTLITRVEHILVRFHEKRQSFFFDAEWETQHVLHFLKWLFQIISFFPKPQNEYFPVMSNSREICFTFAESASNFLSNILLEQHWRALQFKQHYTDYNCWYICFLITVVKIWAKPPLT